MSALAYGIAMAAPGVIKGVSNMFNKPPEMKVSNDTTAYLNKLRNISKTGMYGDDVKNEVSTDIAQASQNTRNAIRSSAVNQGIENSGVVAQQLIKEGGQTTLQAAKIAKKIAMMNEESKLKATEAASRVSDSINAIKYKNALAKYGHRQDTIGAFADALGAGVGGYMDRATVLADKDLRTRETALLDYFATKDLKDL